MIKRAGGNLPCPFCGHRKTYVLESGGFEHRNEIRRRRICYECNDKDPTKGKFTTTERIEINADLVIVKRNGLREPFDKEKLKQSIRIAGKGRNLSEERLDRLVNALITVIDKRTENLDYKAHKKQYLPVPSSKLGYLVMASLKELDHVTLLRYASVFLKFYQKEDFLDLIEEISPKAD